MIRAGRLRSELTLQSVAIGSSSYGAGDETWSAVTTLRGFVRPVSGSARQIGESVQDEATHLIQVRYDGQITTAMRFIEGSKTYQILHIGVVDDKDHELQIECREIT